MIFAEIGNIEKQQIVQRFWSIFGVREGHLGGLGAILGKLEDFIREW